MGAVRCVEWGWCGALTQLRRAGQRTNLKINYLTAIDQPTRPNNNNNPIQSKIH